MLDKKCLICPVRKFALIVVPILRTLYEQNEDILDFLDDFETGINQVKEESLKVIKCK